MSAKKRQHYVPHFLLRRFAAQTGRWQGHIFRLEVSGGRVGPAVPKTEAAKNRYYDLPDELAGRVQPEEILGKIESGASAAICRIEDGQGLEPLDLPFLAYFAAIQTKRTPQDRAEARFFDEFMAAQFTQLRMSARDQAVAFLRAQNPAWSEEQAEAERQRILDGLAEGRIGFESTADREVASMFLGLNDAVALLARGCDWTLVTFPPTTKLVLPDSGYTRYDPHPRVPNTGSGFIDTPTVETVIPVTPSSALLIKKGSGRVGIAEGDAAYSVDLNLRAYAQSLVCIYGSQQRDVVDVHRLARNSRSAITERRRRARILWLLEGQDGDIEAGRPVRGVGHSVEGVREAWFTIDPRAREGQRPLTPEDMWR